MAIDLNKKKIELKSFLGESSKLMSAILSVSNEFPYKNIEFENFLIEFVNENELDFIKVCTESVLTGQDVFRVCHLIDNVIYKFQIIEIDSLVDLFVAFSRKMQGDMTRGMLFEPIRRLAKENNEMFANVAKKLIESKTSVAWGYLNSIYLGISDANFEVGYKKAKLLVESSEADLISSGLRIYGLYPTIPSKFKDAIILQLKEKSKDDRVQIASNAVFSLCQLVKVYSELTEIILDLSRSGHPEIQYEVISSLRFKQGQYDSWHMQCLKSIASYSLKYKGITECYDSIFYNLASSKQYDQLFDLLSSWIDGHSLEEHRDHRIEELLGSATHVIIQDQLLINILCFRWLNSDNYKFHHCLTEILSEMHAHKCTAPEITPENAQTLSDIDIKYIVRKILGYVTDCDFSISLVFSLLKNCKPSEKLQGLIVSVLISHIGYNYPHKTLKYLNRKKNDDLENDVLTTLDAAMVEIEKRFKQVKDLEVINEILPNTGDQIKINRSFNVSMAEAMKKARGKSSFLSMVKEITIKEGIAWFSYLHGQYTSVSKMSSFSQAMELPKNDVLDTVGASIERDGFRRVKRGED